MFFRRKIGSKFILSGFLFVALNASAQMLQPDIISIGVIPGGKPENLKKQSQELAQLIQDELKIPVQIYISKTSYSGLVKAMSDKKVDFAFLSSMTFVQAEKKAGAKVLLKKVWEEPFYYSAIIVKEPSKIKEISQLKGQRIAFVDENSSSGYLYPLAMLTKKGFKQKNFKEQIFSGNHAKSIQLLDEGKVDAAAVFSDDLKGISSAWSQFTNSPKNKYRIIWISESIPTDPFVVRQDFYDRYPKITHSMMFSLIEIFEKYKGTNKFSEILGRGQLIPATSRQYDSVREVAKYLKLGAE